MISGLSRGDTEWELRILGVRDSIARLFKKDSKEVSLDKNT